jgi:outer membrane protein
LRKNELRKNIEQKYHDALAAYKTYNASKISVESLKESFKYTEEKFNVGMVTSVDYSIAKMKLTQAESDLLRAKYDYIFKTKILDFYMGIPLTL